MELRSPRDGELLGTLKGAVGADVRAAYDGAQSAQPGWAALSPKARGDVLRGAAQLFRERADAIGAAIAAEMGKPLDEARAEVTKGAAVFDYYAAMAYQAQGETYRTDTGEDVFVLREPLGVVALVTPWNFPFTLPSRKIAAALATGNAVLLKPAPGGILSGLAIASTIHDAGLPDGLLNVVVGEIADIQEQLFSDPRLAGVSFTGSYASAAAIRRLLPVEIPLQAELGGKNSLVIWRDADLDQALSLIWDSSFNNNGQICTSAGRVLVHEEVADELLVRLTQAVGGRSAGEYGVLASPQAAAHVTEVITRNEDQVAQVVTALWSPGLRGPTVLIDPAPGELRREEIFGPVVTFERIATLEEALARANETAYGLTAGIVTNDLRVAQAFWSGSTAGTVKVNAPLTGTPFHVPMQGFGRSGAGAGEGGSVSTEFFTRRKTVHLRRH